MHTPPSPSRPRSRTGISSDLLHLYCEREGVQFLLDRRGKRDALHAALRGHAMAALAGEQDLHAGLRGQRFERTRQARRLAAKARQLDEALDIDRDHCAVLAML